MHFTNLLLPTLGLLSAVASGAPSVSTSPAKPPQWPQSSEEFRKQHPFRYPPKNHRKVHHIRSSHNEHDDVSDELLKGIKAANNGGTLLLKKGKTYVIGKKLDLTFLNDFQMQLDGKILFTNNVTFWQQPQNYFYHPFQKSITFWKWGGKNVKIFGTGVIDGNGQAWYDGFAGKEILDTTNTYLRPILFYAENATNLSVEGIRFQKSPCWTNFIVTSKNVVFDKVTIENLSDNKNLPKNTDGWDSYNVDGLTVTDAWVNIGDDCFSPKPNTTNIYVENLYCNGTHGVSMGSIGQYPGVKDYISNAVVKNVVMLNAENGARLKGWAGPNVGYGYIKNITFDGMYQNNVDWPIVLDACYFNINATTCAQYPSRVDMQDILFKNFSGSSSGKNGRRVARLVCSPNAVCSNIKLENINLTSPKGSPPIVVCDGIKGDVGVPCEPASTVDA